MTIDAQDVQLIGTSKNGQFPSGLFTSAQPNSTGNAGDLTIKTNTLLVKDGARVNAGTFGAGNGGSLTIDAQDVQIIGRSKDGRFSSSLFAQANLNSIGNAGSLSVTTDNLLVSDGAVISVQNLGQGVAGNLNINADSIQLDNSSITANTTSNNGGNIGLEIADLLRMGNGSQISTNAGTAQTGGNGGNITINTPNGFIVATPNHNNDITANAFEGNGGRVNINATSIFGLIPLSLEQLSSLRPNDLDPGELATNDITAVSQQNPNLNGTVEIDTLNVDPNRGVINLPVEPVEPELVSGCRPSGTGNQSRFVVTGHGGLPLNPRKVFTSNTPQVDWVTRSHRNKGHNNRIVVKESISSPKTIVEAIGWFKNSKGEIVLVANAPHTKLHSYPQIPSSCSAHK